MNTKGLKLALIGLIVGLFTSCKMNAQNSNDDRKKGKERPSIEELFKEMDTDEDGQLSKKEVKGPLKNDFDKIDTNEDGFLSKEEMKKAPKPERRERPRN